MDDRRGRLVKLMVVRSQRGRHGMRTLDGRRLGWSGACLTLGQVSGDAGDVEME